MNYIIDFLKTEKANYSSSIIYFERIIQGELKKPLEILIEDNKIKLYHKITGSEIGLYTPSCEFKELANAFIELRRPSVKLCEIEKVQAVFLKFGINKSIESLIKN